MSILTVAAIGAAVVAAAVGGTALLPRSAHVERSAVIAAEPAAVLALMASTAGYTRINPYRSTDPDLSIAPFGPAAGVGAGFAFAGKGGKGTQTVAAVGDDAVTYAIDLGPMGRPTQTVTVAPVDGGTRVTWQMDADLGASPVMRVMGLFMDKMVGRTIETGLRNIAATL